ncbi:M15 family metallopeptidase [Mycolicibacterium fallax]|uniref:M15 family metallopeptidase n=1 Tax=Mycolicibacterium fallax TaxID=1793 RepID=UPI000A163CA7|nr:M15 family metallopeptidase [Mycolicibacterium fallax]BBY98409.1 D-alanyl-D-alanine carboxypeptidase [Mycolicibacterium fallax]
MSRISRAAATAGSALATAAAGALAVVALAGPASVPAPASATAAIRLVDNTGALTPFDTADPSVGRLDPALLSAIQQAAAAAATEGIAMTVTSGWRTPEFQQQLLDDAIATYGSYAAARQYVQTPEHSRHVTGQAVDIGGYGANQWLIDNGARFGLCRIYANEMWHFELATDAAGRCPALLPNAAA